MSAEPAQSRLSFSGYALLWTGLWLAIMAVALKFRPFLPVDETRYLAVAWEMWRDGNFFVPHLDGVPYSHKPPLLFWLMHAGWAVFGVNEWWPRLVAPLFGLASLFLTATLARRLWPRQPGIAVAAPFILFGCLFWTLFTSVTMFDMMLVFCALLAVLGIIRAWQSDTRTAFIWLSLAIGLGFLAKGPAILLSTLPVALLAPLWAVGPDGPEDGMWSRGWKQWYSAIGFAAIGGVGIALAWAIPAAIIGGEEYRNAIFWGQSAGRMVDSFAHGRPWWWFLAVLPVLVLPWTLWPASWRAIRGLLDTRKDNAIRFCLSWFVPALITFSAISGKQLHYLLPVFPALALLLARLLVDLHLKVPGQASWHTWGLQIPVALFILFGLALAVAPFSVAVFDLPATVGEMDFIWGLVLILLSLTAYILTRSGAGLMARLVSLSILSMALVVCIHLSLRPALSTRFDLRPVSQELGQWQRAGIPLAFLGKYHGQFNFLARLQQPIVAVGLKDLDLENWLAENPQGRLIYVRDEIPLTTKPVYAQSYRGRFLVILDTAQVLADPTILTSP